MIEWPTTRRFDRIATASETLAKTGRWQRSIQLDPQQFSLAQGGATGQHIVRVGIEPRLAEAQRQLAQALGGNVALRALPYVPEAQREVVTLSAWVENMALDEARWGGPYASYVPDALLAAPIDGGVFRATFEDPIRGRTAWQMLARLAKVLVGSDEPLGQLLATALEPEALPADWYKPELMPVRLMFAEAWAAVWRALLGGGPAAVLLAEAVAGPYHLDIVLPDALKARLKDEARPWKNRATPPTRAVQDWQPWIMQVVDEDTLEQAWLRSLRDRAAATILAKLLASERLVAFNDAAVWQAQEGFHSELPLLTALAKLDNDAYAQLLREHDDLSGRFKGKARRQAGAAYMAKLAVLSCFDAWAAELLAGGRAKLEVDYNDAARLREEASRGGIYALLAEGIVAGSAAEVHATDVAEAPQAYETGHLFADLAGFTALTERLKEVEIRQFLRQNFYGPLLSIAKDYFKGGVDLADRGGIRLNNLLGDAISLCGAVGDLLAFAERATALVHEDLGAALRQAFLDQASATAAARRQELEQRISRLKVAVAKGEAGTDAEDEIRRLRAQLDAPDVDAEAAVQLKFGFYVAFGRAPIDLEFDDDIFGKVYVALAEKINESARGVARDGAVKAALDAFAAKFPGRPWAFRVHVGPTISGVWPEAMLDAWPSQPDDAAAVAVSLPGMVKFVGATGMYNEGIALSDEALRALAAEEGITQVRIWEGKSTELLKRLDQRYLMPEDRQTLLLLERGGEVRLVRYSGRVAMKGFRTPPRVWEWVGPWLPVYASLSTLVAKQGEDRPLAAVLGP